MAILDVQHIEKSFGATKVLKDINFSLPEGQVLAIIGSSGSGKTTLLRFFCSAVHFCRFHQNQPGGLGGFLPCFP